jgi:hypothetical protein
MSIRLRVALGFTLALVARLVQFHRYTAEDGENTAPSAVQAHPPDLGEYTHQVLGYPGRRDGPVPDVMITWIDLSFPARRVGNAG